MPEKRKTRDKEVQKENSNGLPDYDNPPVSEVVCGILFEPLGTLLLPHFGLLWEKFKDEYSECQEVAPLMPTIERLDESPLQAVQLTEMPLPRVWFVHKDGGIIQVQRDRFLHNWRKMRSEDEYPRYETVFETFQEHFSTFQQFLQDTNLGTVTPLQYELTYVNLILKDEGWQTISEIGQVFPDFSWRTSSSRFLPTPEAINWRTSFLLPNRSGRLHINIQTGRRREDLHELFRLEITARGIGEDVSSENMKEWFNLAHKWIVRGFEDLTGVEVQKDVWGKAK